MLTEPKDHLDFLAARLRGFTPHLIVLRGGASAKKRREALDELASVPKSAERLVLATGRYIGEGFDDARLDTLLRIPVMADTASGDGGHPRSVATQAGGIDNVATVLAELAEKLDDAVLASLAPLSPVPWAQRLGHLLEQVGASDKAESLARYVAGVVNETTTLVPSVPAHGAPHDARWRLLVNVSVEPEL